MQSELIVGLFGCLSTRKARKIFFRSCMGKSCPSVRIPVISYLPSPEILSLDSSIWRLTMLYPMAISVFQSLPLNSKYEITQERQSRTGTLVGMLCYWLTLGKEENTGELKRILGSWNMKILMQWHECISKGMEKRKMDVDFVGSVLLYGSMFHDPDRSFQQCSSNSSSFPSSAVGIVLIETKTEQWKTR